MATLLKLPGGGSKGVVVFTDRERDGVINPDAALRSAIARLKDRWVVGLHHNWQDFRFRYDPLFDFSMAGPDELKERRRRRFPLVPLDAANFAPTAFSPGGDKFWDVLSVSRPVFFKRIPEMFDAVRELYDRGELYRILLICPIPPYDPGQEETVLYDIRKRYERLFSDAEQERFVLMTIDYRYPFPFDRETLAHFYRSSRVFLHTADDERRPRTVAYAWATGLPVVTTPSVSTLLPDELRREPWYFEAGRASFADQISRAIRAAPQADGAGLQARQVFSHDESVAALDRELARIFAERNEAYELGGLLSQNLDIRIARHHGEGDSLNSIAQQLADFAADLKDVPPERLAEAVRQDDPERYLSGQPPAVRAAASGVRSPAAMTQRSTTPRDPTRELFNEFHLRQTARQRRRAPLVRIARVKNALMKRDQRDR
jgi:glycosyltransferase involved in cell wall biosynthesis